MEWMIIMLDKTRIVLTVFTAGLTAISDVSTETDTAEDIVGTNNANIVVDSTLILMGGAA